MLNSNPVLSDSLLLPLAMLSLYTSQVHAGLTVFSQLVHILSLSLSLSLSFSIPLSSWALLDYCLWFKWHDFIWAVVRVIGMVKSPSGRCSLACQGRVASGREGTLHVGGGGCKLGKWLVEAVTHHPVCSGLDPWDCHNFHALNKTGALNRGWEDIFSSFTWVMRK